VGKIASFQRSPHSTELCPAREAPKLRSKNSVCMANSSEARSRRNFGGIYRQQLLACRNKLCCSPPTTLDLLGYRSSRACPSRLNRMPLRKSRQYLGRWPHSPCGNLKMKRFVTLNVGHDKEYRRRVRHVSYKRGACNIHRELRKS
jgi:hypothetical protein